MLDILQTLLQEGLILKNIINGSMDQWINGCLPPRHVVSFMLQPHWLKFAKFNTHIGLCSRQQTISFPHFANLFTSFDWS